MYLPPPGTVSGGGDCAPKRGLRVRGEDGGGGGLQFCSSPVGHPVSQHSQAGLHAGEWGGGSSPISLEPSSSSSSSPCG